VDQIAGNAADNKMQVNRINVAAIGLLQKDQAPQADLVLQKALKLDPTNPFTLNNLGVAYEVVGDYDNAMKYYVEAAELRSSEPIVITLDRSWRGKQVSAMAALSAKRLDQRIRDMGNAEVTSALFTMRGVYAANQNDWLAAKQDFLHAYSLDPTSAFSLNNRGFVAEMEGDLETAQFFYDKARKAGNSDARVGVATQRVAEGKKLFAVATDSDHQVDEMLDRYSRQRHLETGPIELTPRGDMSDGNSGAPAGRPLPQDEQHVPTQSVQPLQ